MPLLDFPERRAEPVAVILRWSGVRKVKVPNIRNVAVVRRSSCLYNVKDARLSVVVLVFEHGSHAEILRVTEEEFVVLGSPGDVGSLTPSRNVKPKVNAFFNSTFFLLLCFLT